MTFGKYLRTKLFDKPPYNIFCLTRLIIWLNCDSTCSWLYRMWFMVLVYCFTNICRVIITSASSVSSWYRSTNVNGTIDFINVDSKYKLMSTIWNDSNINSMRLRLSYQQSPKCECSIYKLVYLRIVITLNTLFSTSAGVLEIFNL